MFRHAALRPLSRGHQRVLFHAREMKRVPEEALRAFLGYARRELPRHFDAEERVLLPALLARLPQGDPSIDRVRAAHAEIRERVAALTAAEAPSPDAVRELARVLHDHVRDEERNLFPLAERVLGADGLAEIARDLGQEYVI